MGTKVEYGGLSKGELLAELEKASILLNEYAYALFGSELFTTSPARATAELIELSVADLGFPEGACFAELREGARAAGLAPCPLEVGPYFRLHYLDQAEFPETRKNTAPKGSVTVFSEPLSADYEVPKGFYLRKIDGRLWLRGYRCELDNVWEAEDRLAFQVAGK